MITFFHNFSNTWGAKIILGLLALCMVVWYGVGSFANKNPATQEVITVGSNGVTLQEIMRDFDQERQKLTTMAGRYISPQQAISFGLLAQVVQTKITEKLNENIRADLGLDASHESIQKYVLRTPAFLDVTGNFDKNLFNAYLMQNGLSEKQLADDLKDSLAIKHLENTVASLGYAPNALAELAYRFQNEKRDVSTILIEQNTLKIVEKPSDEDLKEYYEAYAEEFMMPEMRRISIVQITPDTVQSKIKISESDVNDLYEEEKSKYVIPEKRDIAQIRFNTRAEADAFMPSLTPVNFADKAVEIGQTPEQTSFGSVSKDEMLDELSLPAFQAHKGDIIGPVEAISGWHILFVKNITPAITPPAAEIKN
ncbi:MAG: SurA N-terminal domain-containing protein, partial [Lactobacillales bacterium]|nr:SurA N-terminal domain-containing protein [Lactobacillales bacterium]